MEAENKDTEVAYRIIAQKRQYADICAVVERAGWNWGTFVLGLRSKINIRSFLQLKPGLTNGICNLPVAREQFFQVLAQLGFEQDHISFFIEIGEARSLKRMSVYRAGQVDTEGIDARAGVVLRSSSQFKVPCVDFSSYEDDRDRLQIRSAIEQSLARGRRKDDMLATRAVQPSGQVPRLPIDPQSAEDRKRRIIDKLK